MRHFYTKPIPDSHKQTTNKAAQIREKKTSIYDHRSYIQIINNNKETGTPITRQWKKKKKKGLPGSLLGTDLGIR
jgi:hypothetical protein